MGIIIHTSEVLETIGNDIYEALGIVPGRYVFIVIIRYIFPPGPLIIRVWGNRILNE